MASHLTRRQGAAESAAAVELRPAGAGRVVVVVHGVRLGAPVARAQGRAVARWLEGGALHDLEHPEERGGAVGAIVGALEDIDRAFDSAKRLLGARRP